MISKLPGLAAIVNNVLSRLGKQALIVFVALIGIFATLVVLVLRPAFNDLEQVNKETQELLASRNQELMRSSVEQATANITRILGAAEHAVSTISTDIRNRSTTRSDDIGSPPRNIFPVDKEFYPGGMLEDLIGDRKGYGSPVSFEFPQIVLGKGENISALKRYWKRFLGVTKALHVHHPELKWLYLGTGNGTFMVFPASPAVPKDFDPRTRPWYQAAVEKKKMVWVSPYFTAGGNDLVLTVAKPLGPDPELRGVVAAVDVVMVDIIRNLLETPYCDKCVFYLLNEKNEILGRQGGETLGDSWKKTPDSKKFKDDLKELLPNKSIEALMAGIASQEPLGVEDQKQDDSLSRLVRANKIELPGLSAPYIAFKTPIRSLGWSLVGMSPANYSGADGAKVMGSVESLASKTKSTLELILIAAAVSFGVLMFLVFRFARRIVRKTMEPVVQQFTKLSDNLSKTGLEDLGKDSGFLGEAKGKSRTREFYTVCNAVDQLQNRLNSEMEKQKQLEVQAKMGNLALKVAHDTRGPLAALKMAIRKIRLTDERERLLLSRPAKRIEDITNRLTTKKGYDEGVAVPGQLNARQPNSKTVHLISNLVDVIVTEKRLQYHLKDEIEIDVIASKDCYGLFVEVSAEEFTRVLSNVIDNAMEAISKKGRVVLSCSQKAGFIELSVKDNGRGISKEILPKLGKKGATFGKTGGSGLGLYDAIQTVNSWGGKLNLESEKGVGTAVTVFLPAAQPPVWFVPELRFIAGTQLVIVDDDDSIVQLWEHRLGDLLEPAGSLKLLHFKRSEPFLNWYGSKDRKRQRNWYFCDFELSGENKTGIDLIKELRIRNQATLVTAHSEESGIAISCEQNKIKMIPKALIEFVPIKVKVLDKPDLVLIDDEDSVREAWQIEADDRNEILWTASTPEEIDWRLLDPETPIYIDQNLSDERFGTDVVAYLKGKGFRRLYLATGENSDALPGLRTAASVVGKEYPEARGFPD